MSITDIWDEIEIRIYSKKNFAEVKDLCTNMTDVEKILEVFSRFDETSGLFWQFHNGEVRFCVNCNDLFYWACADAEPFTVEDIPSLEQAHKDSKDTFTLDLWCCRKRGMRPQKPCYKMYQAEPGLSELFDACGPERDV